MRRLLPMSLLLDLRELENCGAALALEDGTFHKVYQQDEAIPAHPDNE